jgi:thiol:disulfide interchange protein
MRAFLSLWLLCACGSEETEVITPAVDEPAHEQQTGEQAVASDRAVPAVEGPPPEVANPYEPGVNAQAAIDAAIARAGTGDKHVLLVFGGNWCVWCRRLEHVLRNEPRVSAAIRDHFEVVHIDTGARGSGVNAPIAARYGDPQQHGLPVLVVLDGTGHQVATQETGSLEIGDRHDPERVLAFLNRFSS